MKHGDKFTVITFTNKIGKIGIEMGCVTVGKEYAVCGLHPEQASYWFVDDQGVVISTYSFFVKPLENK